jgi:hypothetical protein
VPLAEPVTYGAGHDFERVIALKLSNGEVASFTDGKRAITVWLNSSARKHFGEYGAVPRPGSPIDNARVQVAAAPEHAAAVACAKGQ